MKTLLLSATVFSLLCLQTITETRLYVVSTQTSVKVKLTTINDLIASRMHGGFCPVTPDTFIEVFVLAELLLIYAVVRLAYKYLRK